jgi:hypothetical protein
VSASPDRSYAEGGSNAPIVEATPDNPPTARTSID